MAIQQQVPNLISSLRIAAAPLLVALAYLGHQDAFSWLLVAALLSDILDGAIARVFGFVTRLGSLLDSVADTLTFGAAAYGITRFHAEIVTDHAAVFGLAIALWLGTAVLGFLRYGRMPSFHTLLTRVTAYVSGFFVAILFLWGFEPWLFWTAVTLVVVSQLEEYVLLALLREWTPDARGLYWVLRDRRGAS